MAMHGISQSVWHATASTQRHPPLDGDQRADAVVIGAGITGLTTALLLQRKGLDVVVVEADQVASGVTGSTTAKVTSQHGLLYATLVDKHNRETAATYGMANQAALEQIAALVADAGMDCGFERRPAYVYTQDEARVAAIEREVEVATDLGLPASFTTEVDLPYDVRGAIRFDDQAQFQPVAYLGGLARQLVANGCRIFEQSMVTDVGGSPLRSRTGGGSITSDAVVVATQIPFLDRGLFFTKASPSASHAIAAEIDGGQPLGMYICADTPTRSVRSFTHGEHRYVIVGGEGHTTGEGGDETVHHEALVAFAREHWPGCRVTHHWMAEDYIPNDRLPYVGKLTRLGAPIYVATGFQKWGLTNGTVAAMILAESVTGGEHPWAETFDAHRANPITAAKPYVKHNSKASIHFVRDRVGGPGPKAVADLAPGQGIVVNRLGSHIAVSKAQDGTVTAVSAVCRHLGCIVAFNEAEQTWDCPCHGSRYNADGSVLHGPTVKPLPPEEVPGARDAT